MGKSHPNCRRDFCKAGNIKNKLMQGLRRLVLLYSWRTMKTDCIITDKEHNKGAQFSRE
uniref:Uncharacterized protein n=1 Tax=Anguilla anguilla TaxID=7936 RepID=A0A0E9WPC1_ANGAN